MAESHGSKSIIDSIGEELVRIIAPVSICMLMVVLLVSVLNSDSSNSSSSVTTFATIAYNETTTDTFWDKVKGAILNSLVFVVAVTLVTFLLVLLFYLRCTKFLKIYMGFSAFTVLGFMGGEIAIYLLQDFRIPVDCITFLILLFNFSIVGVIAVFMSKMAIVVTQSYLVFIGVLVAYWFTLLPEWTTWGLLIAMALYDLAAVLLPVGPLRLLVELAISRDEEIPALVFEARPVVNENIGPQRRVWRERINIVQNSSNSISEGEVSAPLIDHQMTVESSSLNVSGESWSLESIGLGATGAIKLGLGDFIFYSVLVGRAAMYDFMTVYACYLAIIAGLGVTLILLAFYEKALPALPVSIGLGVLFYLLTRFLLEIFILQCSFNLFMF